MAKTCDTCKFCYLKDYGYSNWTVEGTDSFCYLNMRKGIRDHHGPIPVPNTCNYYTFGKVESFNVEDEEPPLYSHDEIMIIKAALEVEDADR